MVASPNIRWIAIALAACLVPLLGVLATPSVAQRTAAERTDAAYGAAFESWAAGSGVKGGIVVVNRNRNTVHESTVGGADPTSSVLLGSLSKAITATCIAKLIEEHRLAWSTPLKDALARHLEAYGPPADPRALTITVEQLVVHRAGFSSRPKEALLEMTLGSFLERNTSRDTHFGPLLAATLRHPLVALPGKQFAYSNAGYLALGTIIEEATNESYERACHSRVLAPLGVQSATLDPSWRVLSSYGGWSMSGADYLRFFEIFAPNRQLLGRETRAWIADETAKRMNPQRKHWYALGVRIDPVAGGRLIVSHTGSWSWRQPIAKDGALSASTGAFAIRYADGTSLFTAFWPIPRDPVERRMAYEKLADGLRETHQRLQAGLSGP